MRCSYIQKVKLVVATVLSMQLLSACQDDASNGMPQPDPNPSTSLYDHPGLSKYEKPVDVSFVRQTSADFEALLAELPGQTLEDNVWTRLYEQVLGVRVRYDWTAKGDSYGQKLNVSIASGELPDIVKVNAEQLRQLTNAGLIHDLTDVYEQYATPFTKEILSQEGSGPFDAATIDGKLMAIPETGSSIESAMVIWIRTDWLENLRLDPPRTMGDLLNLSKAFTDGDPDRNGEADTYGLAITNHIWDPVMGVTGFMAGFGAYPNLWLEDKSGKLVYGGIQPEVKTALAELRRLYAEGQLDPEFALKKGDKVKRQIADGRIGIVYGEQWGSFLVQDSRMSDARANWQAFPIVSASGEAPKVPLKFNTGSFFAVSKRFEHPEAVVKLFNLHLEKNWGETAEYETYYSNPQPVWQLSPVTPFPAMKNLEAFRQLDEARRTGGAATLHDEAKAIQKHIDTYLAGGDNRDEGWGWERTYGPDGAFAIIDRYERNGQLLYDLYTGAPSVTMSERRSILYDLQLEAYINIILGNPVDEFEQFAEEWGLLGGDRITAEINEWYAAKKTVSP